MGNPLRLLLILITGKPYINPVLTVLLMLLSTEVVKNPLFACHIHLLIIMGVFKRNNFNRHSISFRGLTDLNDVFSLEAGLNYSFSKAQNGASQGGWNWGGGNLGMMSTYHTPPRNMDIKAYESLYRDPDNQAVETTTPWGVLLEVICITAI